MTKPSLGLASCSVLYYSQQSLEQLTPDSYGYKASRQGLCLAQYELTIPVQQAYQSATRLDRRELFRVKVSRTLLRPVTAK
jgi:hypothetical protein